MAYHPPVIQSLHNPIVKKARSLQHRKYRERHRAFIVEGLRCVEELLASRYTTDSVLYVPERCIPLEGKSHLYRPVTNEVLDSISAVEHHQGCIAIAQTPALSLRSWQPASRSLILVLDGVADPGNVGTMIRTGDAFGAECVLLTDKCADCYNPKSVRAAAGSLFHVQAIRTGRQAIAERLAQEGFQILGTAARGGTPLPLVHFEDRVAIMLGHETRGISSDMLTQVGETISIPISPSTESLNVAAACAVLCWEVFRRRGFLEQSSITGT